MRGVSHIIAVPKLDMTSMNKLVSKRESIVKHRWPKIWVATFLWENENRCADFTTRGRRHKVQVAKVARTSKKICGPTRRDDCKSHDEQKIWTI